jgi:hypothetical protein
MVFHTRTLTALIVDKRSRDVASARHAHRSIVPKFAGVQSSITVTNILLRDVGSESEDRPTS